VTLGLRIGAEARFEIDERSDVIADEQLLAAIPFEWVYAVAK